jgi:Protein tyrosine and serine/threonine kinase
MAPEVVRRGKYSANADTFSWAMIVNELFTEEKPYEFLIPLEAALGVVKRGLRPSQKRVKSARLRRVIAAAWDQDPARRPSWPQILAELEAAKQEACPTDGSRPRKAGGGSGSVRQSQDGKSDSGLSLVGAGGSADGGGGKATIGSLFRKLGSGGGKKEKKDKDDKGKRVVGHSLPMDTEFLT